MGTFLGLQEETEVEVKVKNRCIEFPHSRMKTSGEASEGAVLLNAKAWLTNLKISTV
jgi:hypothetical protein